MSEELAEKLDYKVSFTISLGDNISIPVPQSTVVTWIIMAVIVILAIIFTRNLQVVPKGKQAVMETVLGVVYNLFYGTLGESGKRYIPYLMTVILYLAVANTTGLFGITPPTKDLNVTAALALMSIVLVQYAGIRERGVLGWLKHFTYPSVIVTPMNILELAIKPLSLCMRLFGNILGAYIIMELIIYKIPVGVPLIASAYFDIFDGLLQAYVFCFLTSMYISESIEEEEPKEPKQRKLKKLEKLEKHEEEEAMPLSA